MSTNLAGLLALLLYIVVKDLTLPLLRRRNHRNDNPGTLSAGSDPEFLSFRAEVRAQREEQLRINKELKGNIRDILKQLGEVSHGLRGL